MARGLQSLCHHHGAAAVRLAEDLGQYSFFSLFSSKGVFSLFSAAASIEPVPKETLALAQQHQAGQPVPDDLVRVVEIRVVESQANIQTTISQLNHIPKDLIDISNAGGIESFVAAFRQGTLGGNAINDTSTDDDDDDGEDEGVGAE